MKRKKKKEMKKNGKTMYEKKKTRGKKIWKLGLYCPKAFFKTIKKHAYKARIILHYKNE
jgi:hypothetical protein